MRLIAADQTTRYTGSFDFMQKNYHQHVCSQL